MLNSCIWNPKIDQQSSHSCYCTLDATTSGIKGSHTPVHGLVRSVLSLQHEICVLQVMTECCGNLATRLRVGRLCSTIQLSPLSGLASMKHEATMWYTPGSLLRIRGGPLHGDSWTIQAPSPCNRPPSIFGTWAASAHTVKTKLFILAKYLVTTCAWLPFMC